MLGDFWPELAKAFATAVLAGGASVLAQRIAAWAVRASRRLRGQDLREPVERRLAAILAADVVGYAGLMSADEEGTHIRLLCCRREVIEPKIRGHRGRIVKNTGDGALVEFGSVFDAVRCALEVQRILAARNAALPHARRIALRIGISFGDVIVAADDVYGRVVNLAARLEGLAAPGGVCISRDAWRHVEGAIEAEFVDLGERSLKNITEPAHVYAITPAA
jgi:adenylate cyclase